MVERGESVGEEAYDQILNHMVDSKRFTFEHRFASLREKQKTVLLAIAAEFPKEPTLWPISCPKTGNPPIIDKIEGFLGL